MSQQNTSNIVTSNVTPLNLGNYGKQEELLQRSNSPSNFPSPTLNNNNINSTANSKPDKKWENELLSIPSPTLEDIKYSAFDSLRLSEGSTSNLGWSVDVVKEQK